MRYIIKIIASVILITLYSYLIKKWFCRELRIPYFYSSPTLNETRLDYDITYEANRFKIEGMYDILFIDKESSTNGVPFYIEGTYGENVSSKELWLKGSSGVSGMKGAIEMNRKYYVTGIINRPDNEKIREQNKKALSIHVEESYIANYSEE